MTVSCVTVRVWRQGGPHPEKLLFAPGYQRPWPVWKDVEKRYWSKRVLTAWEVKQGVQNSELSATSVWQNYGDNSDLDDSGVEIE